MIKKILFFVHDRVSRIYYLILSLLLIVFFSNLFSRLSIKRKLNKSCVVVGNGPSFPYDITEHKSLLDGKDLFCVNDFAQTVYYKIYKPKNYVILEPSFWDKNLIDEEISIRNKLFFDIVNNTEWPMNLFLPNEVKKSNILQEFFLNSNENISVHCFNRTPIDYRGYFSNCLYKLGLGMPPPHNVLIAALFLSINMGYNKIFLIGADHSWHENITVGSDNILYVKQLHFYDSKNATFEPIYKKSQRKGCTPQYFLIHEIFERWSKVFLGYHQLKEYALKNDVQIFNISKKSYIDAFDRG